MIEFPRLSPSIAKTLIDKSPAHAYNDHRLLGGGRDDNFSEAKDRGLILESIIFGFGLNSARFKIIQSDSYRTNESKQLRDEARSNNQIPILEKDCQEYLDLGNILCKKINDQGIHFNNGEFQKHAEWTSIEGVNCHGYLDYWHTQALTIIDLKIMDDVSPKKFGKSFIDYSYDLQGAAYLEGIETLNPELSGRVKMLFIACESKAPFVVQFYEMSGMMLALGQNKWQYAKDKWKQCIDDEYWPGYFEGVGRLEPMPWHMNFEQIIDTKSMED